MSRLRHPAAQVPALRLRPLPSERPLPQRLSLERHRLLWLYLQRETDLPTAYPRILHIAPEVCLMRKLRKHYDGHPGLYLTADLESPLADLHFDVAAHSPRGRFYGRGDL